MKFLALTYFKCPIIILGDFVYNPNLYVFYYDSSKVINNNTKSDISSHAKEKSNPGTTNSNQINESSRNSIGMVKSGSD